MNGIELPSWCKFGILGLPVCVSDIRTRSMFRSLPKAVLLLNVLWYYYVKYFAKFLSSQIQWARFALLLRVFFFLQRKTYWQKNKGVLQIVSRKSQCQKLRPLPFLQTIFVWRINQVVLHQRCEMKFRRWSQPATSVTLREYDGYALANWRFY